MDATGVGGAMLRYTPSRFVEPLLGFLTIPILTRTLGASAYGDLSVVLLTAGLLRVLGYDWINNCALRFRKPMESELDRFFSNQLTGLLVAAGATALLVYAAADLLPERIHHAIGGLLIWTLLDATATAFTSSGEMILRAEHRSMAFSVSTTLQGIARHVLGVGGLLLVSRDIPTYFLFRVVGLLLVALWSWTLIGAWRHLKWRAVSWAILKRYLVFGGPLAAAVLATSMRTAGNRYVVLSLTGSESTGLFSAAVNIGGAPLMILQQIVMLGLYPLAIDAWEKGQDYRPIVRDGLRWFVLGGLPALAGLALLSRPLLAVVAGAQYSSAWPALSLTVGAMFFYGLSQYFSLRFVVAKRTPLMAAIGLSTAAANIGLSLYLVPRYGYASAAFSTLVACAVMLMASMIWGVRPGRDLLPVRSALRSSLATLVMASVLWGLMKIQPIDGVVALIVAMFAGAAVYFLVIWITGEIDNELRRLKDWAT